MSLILIYETQKLFCYLKKIKWGALPTYVSHVWVSSFWKTLFDVEYYRQINIINLLNDDCNLEGFSFKHL